MSPDVRHVLRRGAAEPERGFDMLEVTQRVRRIGRWRLAAAVVAAALLVPATMAGGSMLLDRTRVAEPTGEPTGPPGPPTPYWAPGAAMVRRVPGDFGSIDAPTAPFTFATIARGRRVYVVRHVDGRVSVLDAAKPRQPRVTRQLGWCEQARVFRDDDADAFDEYGVYRRGLATVDMVRYETEPAGGGRLRVTARLEAVGRGTSRADPPAAACELGAAGYVAWDLRSPAAESRVEDLPDGRWSSVDAVLGVWPDGEARLCARLSQRDRCRDGLPVERALPADSTYAVAGRFAALRRGDRIVELHRVDGGYGYERVWRIRSTGGPASRTLLVDDVALTTGSMAQNAAFAAGETVPVRYHLEVLAEGIEVPFPPGAVIHTLEGNRAPSWAEFAAYVEARPGGVLVRASRVGAVLARITEVRVP